MAAAILQSAIEKPNSLKEHSFWWLENMKVSWIIETSYLSTLVSMKITVLEHFWVQKMNVLHMLMSAFMIVYSYIKTYPFELKFLNLMFYSIVQQKIVIKVSMHCNKCRTRALKIAAVADGMFNINLPKSS